jgi:hypothetical protein
MSTWCAVVTAVLAEHGGSPVKAACGALEVSQAELRGRLRELREQGLLVTKPEWLQTPVRFYDDRSKYGNVKYAAYVFRGHGFEMPRRRRQVSVLYW